MKIEYQCTAAEFGEAFGTAWNTLLRRLLRYWTIAAGGLLVLVAVWRLSVTGLNLSDVILGLIGVFWIGFMTFFRGRYARSHFAKHPNLQQPFQVDITDDGIRFASVHGVLDLRWSAYTKVIETKNLFVLYQGDCDFSFLPKRAFPQGGLEEFRDLLLKKIPRH